MSKLIDFDFVGVIHGMGDIQALPGYVETLSPRLSPLSDVLDEYQLKEMVRCGINECRQPHFHGFVVTTENGNLTNIGKDCGRHHFGETFTLLKNARLKAIRADRTRAYLIQRRTEAHSIQSQLSEMTVRKFGLAWLIQAMREFERLFPSEVYHRVVN